MLCSVDIPPAATHRDVEPPVAMATVAAPEDSEDQCIAMLIRFLDYPCHYRYKNEFMDFCLANIVFSGSVDDFVLREDVNTRFIEYSGITPRPYVFSGFRSHLLAARVKISRLRRHNERKYYYIGIRFVEDTEMQSVDFQEQCNVTTESDDETILEDEVVATKEEERKTVPQPTSSSHEPVIMFPPTVGMQNNRMVQKLLDYLPHYREKDDFTSFCLDNIMFTGSWRDVVCQRDLINEFIKYLGGTTDSTISLDMHLGAAGVVVVRLGRNHDQEYGYSGIRFVDRPGRRHILRKRSKESRSDSGSVMAVEEALEERHSLILEHSATPSASPAALTRLHYPSHPDRDTDPEPLDLSASLPLDLSISPPSPVRLFQTPSRPRHSLQEQPHARPSIQTPPSSHSFQTPHPTQCGFQASTMMNPKDCVCLGGTTTPPSTVASDSPFSALHLIFSGPFSSPSSCGIDFTWELNLLEQYLDSGLGSV